MRFRMSASPETFLAETFLRRLPPNCWKDMQGKADETERPLVWPGVTVGGVSLNWNPESLSGICARREVMVDLESAMPTDVRRQQQD
jgi:hypothetical protein